MLTCLQMSIILVASVLLTNTKLVYALLEGGRGIFFNAANILKYSLTPYLTTKKTLSKTVIY